MGIQDSITKMPTKLKQLYMNILSVILIIAIAYGAITFMQDFIVTGNFMTWFTNPAFLNVIVIVVIVLITTKLLKGGKLQIPQSPTGQKQQFDIPDTWGVKKYGQTISQQQQQPKQPRLQRQVQKPIAKYTGTWNCQCGFLAMGDRCARCGEKR